MTILRVEMLLLRVIKEEEFKINRLKLYKRTDGYDFGAPGKKGRSGFWTFFDKGGRLKAHGRYLNGAKTGVWIEIDDNSRPFFTVYEKGRKIRTRQYPKAKLGESMDYVPPRKANLSEFLRVSANNLGPYPARWLDFEIYEGYDGKFFYRGGTPPLLSRRDRMPEAIITNVDDLRSCVDSLVIKAIQDCEDQYSESVASLSYILSVLLELRPLAAREKAAANYRENIENVRQKFAEQFNNCSAIESVPPKFRKTLEERFLKHSKAVAGSR